MSLFWGSFFYIHSALWRIQLELICLLFTSPCREICSVSKILHSRRFAIPSPHPRLIVDWNLCLQHVLIVSTLFVYHGFIFFSLMIASVQTFFSFSPSLSTFDFLLEVTSWFSCAFTCSSSAQLSVVFHLQLEFVVAKKIILILFMGKWLTSIFQNV